MASGSDPTRIRQLLATAQGYRVFGSGGRRIGAIIGVGGPGGEAIAIRHDGILLWRRRLLPVTAVAEVLPERRAVMLNVDGRILRHTGTVPTSVEGRPDRAAERAPSEGDRPERIARYVSLGESDAGHGSASNEREESLQGKDPEHHRPCAATPSTLERPQSGQRTIEAHLLFVSTSSGYMLVERDGPPPSLGRELVVPDEPGLFRVVKLAFSPLPRDARVCAYVEHAQGGCPKSEIRAPDRLSGLIHD